MESLLLSLAANILHSAGCAAGLIGLAMIALMVDLVLKWMANRGMPIEEIKLIRFAALLLMCIDLGFFLREVVGHLLG